LLCLSVSCCGIAFAIDDTKSGKGGKQVTLAMNMTGCRFCTKIIDLMYTEAFNRLGYGFAYSFYPLKRSLLESDSGRVDGETARLKFDSSIREKYPNLVLVDEVVWESVVAGYSIDPGIHLDGWASLKKNHDIIIGYPRGHLHIEKMLKEHNINPVRVYETTDARQGLRMLASKRINLFIESDINIEGSLLEKEFRSLTIGRAGELSRVPLFPYLHKRHAAMAPRLAAALKEMKADHTYDLLIKRAQREAFGYQREIFITSGTWPPFTGPDLLSYGTAADIISRAFSQKDYKVSFLFRPWMRAFMEAKSGLTDGSILWRRTKEREKDFFYSDPVISVSIVLFHLKSIPFHWKQVKDLENFRSGVVNGFKYKDDFDFAVASGQIPAEAVASQEMNLLKLLKGRIDYTPIVLQSGYATLKQIFPPETCARFTHHPLPLGRQKLYLILSRKVRGNQQVLTDFNQGLFLLNRKAQ